MTLKQQLAALEPGARLWTPQARHNVNAAAQWLRYSGTPRKRFAIEKDATNKGYWVTCVEILPDL